MKKSLGIVRKLDNLGRIVLPRELRDSLDIKDHEPLEIFIDEDEIILKKYKPGCIVTGEMEDLVECDGVKMSKSLVRKFMQVASL